MKLRRDLTINRNKLHKLMGWPDKLHKDFEGEFKGVVIPSYYNSVVEPVGTFDIVVFKTGQGPTRRNVHRVFVRCPVCGELIPAGRFHQHAQIHKEYTDEVSQG